MENMHSRFLGMTVNERLDEIGLFDDFYKAVEERKIERAIEILKKVELNDTDINSILDSLGLKGHN